MLIKRIDKTLRGMIFILYFGIFFLALYAPVIQHVKGYPAGENIYSLFSPICHQYPTRCFWIFDRPWALCARCASAYLGIAIAALVSRPKYTFSKRALIGVTVICFAAIDPMLQLFGFYESTNVVRSITGLAGGYGAFMLIYPLPFKYKEQVI